MVAFYPETIEEALAYLADGQPTTIYAGGTDLMVTKNIKERVCFVQKIPEMVGVTREDGEIAIGAATTYSQLIADEQIPEEMKRVFGQVASPAIRNRGSIGGNICNASPVGDTLPMLYACDAQLELGCLKDGTVQRRIVPLKDFITGVRKIELQEGEMLLRVLLPEEVFGANSFHYHKKVGARKAEAISKLSFYGRGFVEDGGVKELSIVFGAMGVTMVWNDTVNQLFENSTKADFQAKKEVALETFEKQLKPISDLRSTAEYRKTVSMNLLKDFLEEVENKL